MTYEIDPNGGDVGFGVGVIGEPQQEARLSDAGVTDEQKLEEVVVSGGAEVRQSIFREEPISKIDRRRHPGRLGHDRLCQSDSC